MRDSYRLPLWSVSKSQAAQLTIYFVALGLVEVIAETAPVWSALPFLLAVLSGGWWLYRWHGDLQLAQHNHLVHTMLQTRIQPARATPTTKPGLFVPDTTERAYGPATRL